MYKNVVFGNQSSRTVALKDFYYKNGGERLKKTAFVLVLVILISIFHVSALAVNYEIGETNVSAAIGEEIDIPVAISKNIA